MNIRNHKSNQRVREVGELPVVYGGNDLWNMWVLSVA